MNYENKDAHKFTAKDWALLGLVVAGMIAELPFFDIGASLIPGMTHLFGGV